MNPEINPIAMLRPRRKITGISAVLLPFTADGAVDWLGFEAHVARTAAAGLIPAVNMDTGYANLIPDSARQEALQRAQAVMGGELFVAGAYVSDQFGCAFNPAAYMRETALIQTRGGLPIIFQSFGLTGGDVIAAYEQIAAGCDRFIAFELGQMFAPFGAIYDLDTYAGLLAIRSCIGAKHSSLSRHLEWQRLLLRDSLRPEFMVLTGNDLAVDMVMYGSDYLLGLSTFAPDYFARRDAYWQAGDPAFYELNDLLQYLGFFAFRPPVPDYKHSAAQFLKLRQWISADRPHPQGGSRPESDVTVLSDILARLEAL